MRNSFRSGEEDQIQLNVRFECDNERSVELRAVVDSETRLPVRLNIRGSAIAERQLALSYPAVSVAERLALDFPSDMPVVDLDAHENVQTVLNDPSEEANAVVGEDTVVVKDTVAPAPEVVQVAVEDQTPALVGAASKWRPVSTVKRSNGEVQKELDELLRKLWADNGIEPAEAADGEELLRRVYLDLAGRIPSVKEVRSYLGDQSPQRYPELVDRLLNSHDHATHLAAMYRTFLIPEGIDLSPFGGIEAFEKWLSEQFAGNESYDKVVRRLLLAEGRLSKSGPLLFYSATKLDADQLAARTSRVFLGMRLECAQCHDHPFEPWTQEDFWSYAAFFARISRPQGPLDDVYTVMRVQDVKRGEVMIPDSDRVMAPKFLNSTEPMVEDQADERRQKLAKWLTSAGNPYFPRATANRVWGQMFGKGIVNPVDDFGVENPPVSPELLDLLASHFINTDFNLRELFRTVALSRAYQLSSGAETVDETRVDLFGQMNVKTLTAEQVYDCITVATMPSGAGTEGFNVVRFGNASRDQFLQQFRTPGGRRTEYLGGIPQALTLMNGTLIDSATGLSSSGLLTSLDAPFFKNKERIEVLFFATMSRRPRTAEWELLQDYISEDASRAEVKEGLADILWALLNSAEFTMNH